MSDVSEPRSDTESSVLKSSLFTMRGGMILVGLGSLVTILTYLRAAPGQRYFQMWGLMALGSGAMVYGYIQGRRGGDPEARSRLDRAGAACLVVVAIAAGAWYGARLHRAPFWSAVEALAKGNDAARKLRAIAERHVARMEAGAEGTTALNSWKESAAEAIPLRAAFLEAAAAARYLQETAGGVTRERAVIDAQFFPLCLEWIDLYAAVQRQLGEESMADAPIEWEIRQDEIAERIQALPSLPEEGS